MADSETPVLRAWPTEDDLSDLIESCGVVDTTNAQFAKLNLASKIEAAIEAFETQTKWTPFLADGTATTRSFDFPAGGYLTLDGGLVSITTVASGGQVLTAGQQYVPKPDNAPQRKKPYTSIALRGCPPPGYGISPGRHVTIDVTGVWGYAASVPADVFDAVLGYAAALCVPQIALQISGGVYKMDDIQYSGSSSTPLSAECALWQATFNDTVSAKRRVVL